MYIFLLILFIIICFLLVGIILIQHRSGAGMASVFGGGGAETLFGSSSVAPLITKTTSILIGLYLFFSLIIVLMTRPTKTTSDIETEIEKLRKELKLPVKPLEK